MSMPNRAPDEEPSPAAAMDRIDPRSRSNQVERKVRRQLVGEDPVMATAQFKGVSGRRALHFNGDDGLPNRIKE
jgi:hypothetical protein